MVHVHVHVHIHAHAHAMSYVNGISSRSASNLVRPPAPHRRPTTSASIAISPSPHPSVIHPSPSMFRCPSPRPSIHLPIHPSPIHHPYIVLDTLVARFSPPHALGPRDHQVLCLDPPEAWRAGRLREGGACSRLYLIARVYMLSVLLKPSSLAYLLLMLLDLVITTIVYMIRRSSVSCEGGGQWHARKGGWVQRLKSDVRNVGRKSSRHSDIR